MPFGKQTTVVRRESSDENTFAVVHWQGVKRERLLEAITRAVTRWVDETELGKSVWDHTCEELNIADLEPHLDDEALKAMLANEGVHDLELYCDTDPLGDWTYDMVLVDAVALKTEEDDQ